MTPIGNFRALREFHDKSAPPMIPTPTIYLKDLMFIEDGNGDWWDGENKTILNLQKINLLGKVINKIQDAQQIPYQLVPLTVVQDYLQNAKCLSVDELNQRSHKVEPSDGN
eukprot:TRINITY_DN14204_c0_g1_i1.p1 TRINITY_DN14204_c0_g1~~TRINITY_DN14204_c0_g1_i1.p1  ORF type:complete len:118 (-),score=24.03 TRINITY_DN14204_c0_g1_i1:84-416(-)